MKFSNSDEGVSEIIGTILLLSIVVGMFGIVYMTVFNYEFSEMKPTTQLSTTIEGQDLIPKRQSNQLHYCRFDETTGQS